ncbi:MAG: hypothetical protein S4CHLAM45_08610 [Chlamydiales bacterium]|nr:hypothetical protein [Chlamydiales bacterium]MCH9620389.1 hypothetical protein [Chlamydiales bacterium]MCH9622965.1 hypothetical protein [Chlamydiales bacterium]
MKEATDRITLFSLMRNPMIFFVLVSVSLLTLTVGIAFLKPCGFTPYFPYIALGSVLLTARFKTVGIILTYALIATYLFFFYSTIDPQVRLWQMGLILTLATTSFVFLLSFEEIEESSGVASKELEEQENRFKAVKEQLIQLEESSKGSIEELKNEIERLKEEADARLIERTQDKRNLELLAGEIELLTSQKQEILTHAAQLAKEEGVAVDSPELKRELIKMEGLYKQLRSQFDEKSKVLLSARKELFKVEGKAEALEREQEQHQLEPIEGLEGVLAKFAEENIHLEEELTSLEELISHILSDTK